MVTNTLDFPDRMLGEKTNKRRVQLKVGQWEASNDQRGDREDLLLKSQTVASLGTGQTSYKINFLHQQTHSSHTIFMKDKRKFNAKQFSQHWTFKCSMTFLNYCWINTEYKPTLSQSLYHQ